MSCRTYLRTYLGLAVAMVGVWCANASWAAAQNPSSSAATDARPADPTYERTIRPPPLSATEEELVRMVQSWTDQRGHAARHDGRLSHTAQALLRGIPASGTERLAMDTVRSEAWRWGITDGWLAALSLKMPRGRPFAAPLMQKLQQEFDHLPMNRFGLAAASRASGQALLLVWSHHLVHLAPLPTRTAANAEFLLSGEVAPNSSNTAASLTLVLGYPAGALRRTSVPLERGKFSQIVSVGARPGVMEVQLLLDRGQGPEIAALFPIGIDVNPLPWPSRPGARLDAPEAPSAAATPMAAAQAEEALLGLLLDFRRSQGLEAPPPHPQLAAIARRHAQQMQNEKFFAHVSPTAGDAGHRLHAYGIAFVQAFENIAVDTGVEDIVAQWLLSPAHRANLLAANVTAIGVGVSIQRQAAADKLYAVCLLAQLQKQPIGQEGKGGAAESRKALAGRP